MLPDRHSVSEMPCRIVEPGCGDMNLRSLLSAEVWLLPAASRESTGGAEEIAGAPA